MVFYQVVSQKQNLNVRINTVGIECTQQWLIVCYEELAAHHFNCLLIENSMGLINFLISITT